VTPPGKRDSSSRPTVLISHCLEHVRHFTSLTNFWCHLRFFASVQCHSFLFCDPVSLLWQNDTAWQQTRHKMRFSCSFFPQNVFAFILYYYWPTVIKKGLIEVLRELQILGQGVAPSHEQSRKRLFFFTLLAPLGRPFWRPWGAHPWTDRSPPKLIIFPGDIPHPHSY